MKAARADNPGFRCNREGGVMNKPSKHSKPREGYIDLKTQFESSHNQTKLDEHLKQIVRMLAKQEAQRIYSAYLKTSTPSSAGQTGSYS